MKNLKENKISDQSTSNSNILRKRHCLDVCFENYNENETEQRLIEQPNQVMNELSMFSKKLKNNTYRDNSSISSIVNEFNKNKEGNHSDFHNKFSQRSIIMEDHKLMTESIKDPMDFTPFLKTTFKMNDNSPLNNSCSAIEEDFWKNKNLTENEYSVGEDYADKFNDHKLMNNNFSIHPKIDMEDPLSDIEIHKNPNLYKGLKSISYSICDRSVSPVCQNKIFQNEKESFLVKKSPVSRMKHLAEPKYYKQVVSEKVIVTNSRKKFLRKEKNITPVSFNFLNTKNLFQQSEKSIKINEEMIKTKFKMQSQMSKFNNGQTKYDLVHPNKTVTDIKRSSESRTNQSVKMNTLVQKNLFQESFKEESLMNNEITRLEEMIDNYISSIDQKQFKKYKNLLAILISLFVVGDINEKYHHLSKEESQILKIIMYRKFKKNIDIK